MVRQPDDRIGQTVALIRGQRSQKEIGEHMAQRGWKWSQSTVWAVESGKRPLRYSEAIDLCELLDVPLDALSGPFHPEGGIAQALISRLSHEEETTELIEKNANDVVEAAACWAKALGDDPVLNKNEWLLFTAVKRYLEEEL